jgi:hypothetical protein
MDRGWKGESGAHSPGGRQFSFTLMMGVIAGTEVPR